MENSENTVVRRGRPPMVVTTEMSEGVPGKLPNGMREMHTILRTISSAPNGVDHFTGQQVDDYVGSYLSAGWQIVSVHLLSNEKDGASFAFFLVR